MAGMMVLIWKIKEKMKYNRRGKSNHDTTTLNFTKSSAYPTSSLWDASNIHHHIACPSDHHVHPMHTTLIQMVPAAKIQWKARMDHHVGRCASCWCSLCCSPKSG